MRRLERLNALKEELGGDVSVYELDVTSAIEVERTMARIEKEAGAIGVLVNNAGLALGLEPAYEANLEEWDRCIETNIKGLIQKN